MCKGHIYDPKIDHITIGRYQTTISVNFNQIKRHNSSWQNHNRPLLLDHDKNSTWL
jgi:hypothetical protein